MGNTKVYPRPESAPSTRTAAPLPPRPESAQKRGAERSTAQPPASFPREGEPGQRYVTPAARLCEQVEREGAAQSLAREVFKRGAGKEWMGLGPRRPRPASSALARVLADGAEQQQQQQQQHAGARAAPARPASASHHILQMVEAEGLTGAQQLEVMAALKAEQSSRSEADSSMRAADKGGGVKGGSILVSNGSFVQRRATVNTRRTAHVAFSDTNASHEEHLCHAPGSRLEQALGDLEDLERQRTQLPQSDLFVLVNRAKNLPEREKEYESSLQLTIQDPFRGTVVDHQTTIHNSLTHPVWEAAFKLDCRNLDQEAVIAVQCWHHPARHTWPRVVLDAGKASVPLRGLPRFKLVTRWVHLSAGSDLEAEATSPDNASTIYNNTTMRSSIGGGALSVQPSLSFENALAGGKKGKDDKVAEARVELKFFFGDEESFKGFQAQHVHQQLNPNAPPKHSKLRRGSTAKVAPAASVPFVSEPNATGSRSPWAFLRETFVSEETPPPERSKPKPSLNGAAKSVIKLLRMVSPSSTASGFSRTGSSSRSSPASKQSSILSSRSPSPQKLLWPSLKDKDVAPKAALAKVREDAARDADWEDAGVAASFFAVWRQHHSGSSPISKHSPLPRSRSPLAHASLEQRISSPIFPTSPISSGWRPIRRSSLLSLQVAPHTPEPDALSPREESPLDSSLEESSSPAASRRWRRLRLSRKAVKWSGGEESEWRHADVKLAGMEQLCPDWKTLSLSSVPAVNDAFLEHLARQRGPELFALILSGCTTLTHRGVQAIVSKHRMLTHVDLSGAEQTTDACVEGVVGALEQLTTLAVSRCLRITDQALIAVGRECAQLKSFECECCMLLTDAGCSAIARGCSRLEKLSLRGCVGIGSAGVCSLGEGARALRDLCVSGLRKVSTAAIARVAKGCAGLRALDLGMCQGADDRAVEAVAVGCAKLQALGLCSTGITDVGLTAVGKRLTGLAQLDLGHCKRVTDFGVFKVAAGCTKLERLSLDACAVLSDAAVALLADRCEALRTLSLRGCKRISSSAVGTVLEQCRHLRRLDLTGTQAAADEAEVREAVARTAGARAADKEQERLALLCGGKGEAERLGLGPHILPAEEGLQLDFGAGTFKLSHGSLGPRGPGVPVRGPEGAASASELVGFRAERDLSVAQVRSLVRDLDADAAHGVPLRGAR